MLSALPLGETPSQWIKPPLVVVSQRALPVGDATPERVGNPGVWVPRMLTARWTEATRRLAG